MNRIYKKNGKYRTTCPNCGAAIVSEKCPYCGTVFIDFACISMKEPFWLKMKLDDGRILVQKVLLTSASVSMSYGEDPETNMTFRSLTDENKFFNAYKLN